jgi:hypothetical protein
MMVGSLNELQSETGYIDAARASIARHMADSKSPASRSRPTGKRASWIGRELSSALKPEPAPAAVPVSRTTTSFESMAPLRKTRRATNRRSERRQAASNSSLTAHVVKYSRPAGHLFIIPSTDQSITGWPRRSPSSAPICHSGEASQSRTSAGARALARKPRTLRKDAPSTVPGGPCPTSP